MDRDVGSGPPSALDICASMTPSTSMKFEGKQQRTSGWFFGSFMVRTLAALIVPAMMLLIAAIWVRCGLVLVELGPPLDDAMLCGCSWGRFFERATVVQLFCGVSSCVCEPDDYLHSCFPGNSYACDTDKGQWVSSTAAANVDISFLRWC